MKKYLMNKDDMLYIYSMGKKIRVTSIFTDNRDCNIHCERTNDAVIACFGDFIFCADKYDKGI